MELYFAPLEGITGYIFRNAYQKNFGGIDCYYTPFVTTRDGGIMKKKEKKDILPENNQGLKIVPQVMTNQAEDFCQAAEQMEEMGYEEVNLNLGCPSGTIVPKGKGAGFLRTPDILDAFLDEVFSRVSVAVSIKSRIGFYDVEEFPKLLEIYNQYPIEKLILHLRTREEFYKEPVHPEVFSYAEKYSKNPLCYNGDICSLKEIIALKEEHPYLKSVMIGRGFLKNPGFVHSHMIDGACDKGIPEGVEKKDRLIRISSFLYDTLHGYEEVMSGEVPVLFKMKEIWTYLKEFFPNGERYFRKIKKMKKIAEYQEYEKEIFEEAVR